MDHHQFQRKGIARARRRLFERQPRTSMYQTERRFLHGDVAAVNVMAHRGRTDFSRLVDVSGLNTHLATEWVDDSRAVRANEARL